MGFFKTQQMRKCNRRCAAILSLAIAASMFMNVPMQAEAANASVSMGETSQLSKELLADISFDGSSEDVGSVTTSGSVTYGTGVYGNAAYFNGSASNYLKVLGESGKNDILVGRDAATISFFSKCESSIWPFYAAPNSNAQTYQSENYIGILDKASTIQFERYYQGRGSSFSSASAAASYTSGEWKHVALVLQNSSTKMYVNGVLVSEAASQSTLKDLFAEESHLYLGHANWGSGEGFKGYIDEFQVYSWALSEDEISDISSMNSQTKLEREILADISFDAESTDVGVVGTYGSISYNAGVSGNAAYFDGNAANYLMISEESGEEDILAGRDAVTVSFYSKCEGSIWPFYAAPYTAAQTYPNENYIGVLDNVSSIQFERYCNGRLNNTSSVSSKVSYTAGEWKHVVLVIEDSVTKMYINGSLVSEVASNSTLSDLFTNESYIYLGRANWGSGESYKGYIDEFKIFSWALSDIEIAELSSYYDVDSAYDFYDTMFSVKNTGNGKYVAYDGGVKANAATAEKASVQVVRYGDTDTSDSTDNIPVALQAGSNLYYFTLSGNASAGTALTAQKSLKTDKTQQFVLKKSSNWSENYMAYKIYHPLSGMYVGYTNSGSYALSAYGKNAPSYDFVFEKKGYSIVGQLKALPGYALLSNAEKERIQDIASGTGSYSFFRYGGTTDWAFGFSMNLQVQKIVDNKYATTANEQAAAIRTVMDNYIYHGQSNYYGLPKLPGADDIQVTLSNPTYGNYDFWRGTYLNGNRYTLTIKDNYGTQSIDYYVEDQGNAITNGNRMMEALKQIPYPLRRNIRTIKIRNDGANSYNCGTNDLYMRLNWCPSVGDIAQYIVHEFGHSLDFTYGVSSSGAWTTAMNNDVVSISSYGDSNSNEDFAEFGRMYFQSYGNANAAYGLRQMFPNRYAKYVEVLKAAGYEDILAEGYGN